MFNLNNMNGLRKLSFETKAQSSLEYMSLFVGFMALVLALAALWRAGEQGVYKKAIDNSASHILKSNDPAGHIADILLY